MRAREIKKSCPTGTERLENLAFIDRAMGLVNPATVWQDPTLDLQVYDRRSSGEEWEIFLLLPLSRESSY